MSKRSHSSSSSCESASEYTIGGYHPASIGDKINNFKLIKKLGFGHFSTVWLALDGTSLVALKIVKSAQHYSETAIDEIKLLEKCKEFKNHEFSCFIVDLKSWFNFKGPNGVHVVMAFEVLGVNLLDLVRLRNHQGIDIGIVKRIAKQILKGLVFLHDVAGIIHTDLKPENVLITIDVDEILDEIDLDNLDDKPDSTNQTQSGPKTRNQKKKQKYKEKKKAIKQDSKDIQDEPQQEIKYEESKETSPNQSTLSKSLTEIKISPKIKGEFPKNISIKIADLGNACYTTNHFSNDIQTRQYRSPEAILGAAYSTSADIWSFGGMIFELLTGDYLFDPKSGSRYTKDDDHIAQIIELLGGFPRSVALSGKYSNEIFNRKGELRNVYKLRYWKLDDVLMDKYRFPKDEARDISDFILPCLQVNSERRIRAAELLKHKWLQGS